MSEAEVLLNSLTGDIPTHDHVVVDTDPHFTIDPDTREIINPNRRQYIMQGDHNSEVYTFEMPRYIDGHDMMLCNQIKVHYINISEDEETQYADVADASPMEIKEVDENTVFCTWRIDRKATQYVGNLSFGIEYQCVAADGEVVYEWNTDIYTDVIIKDSLDHSEQVIADYSNILEQWRAQLFGAGDSVIENINTMFDEQKAAIQQEGASQVKAVETTGETQVTAVKTEGTDQIAAIESAGSEQQAAIQLKTEEALESIPEDYTEVSNMADEALRTKANAVKLNAEGETIFVDDSADSLLMGMSVYGKTTQVTTTGANLLNPSNVVQFLNNAGNTRTGIYLPIETDGTYTYHIKQDTYTVYIGYSDSLDAKSENVAWSMRETPVSGTIELRAGQYFLLWFDDGVLVDRVDPTYFFLGLGADISYEPYTGGKPSPSSEYPQELTSIENPRVNIYGKNLINFWAIQQSANTSLEISDDGYTITLVGGSTYPYTSSHVVLNAERYRGKTVIFKLDHISSTVAAGRGCAQLAVKTSKKTTYLALSEATPKFEVIIPDDVVSITLGLYSNNTNAALETDNTVVIKGLMLAIEDGKWETYKPVQTISIPRSLPGIPVTDGGNYTDPNGQQWICDEIDFERGVYVQRVTRAMLPFTKSEYVHSPLGYRYQYYAGNNFTPGNVCMCTTLPYNNEVGTDARTTDGIRVNSAAGYFIAQYTDTAGTTNTIDLDVMYILATPIETPLTAEELLAYKHLKTHYPNTTVINDSGAYMTLEYSADLEKYFHNTRVIDGDKIASDVNAWLTTHFTSAEGVSF